MSKLNTKIQNLERAILAYGRVALCLSGGVDSGVLLKFCAEILGAENVLAVVGVSPYMISGEIDFAKKLCVSLGVRVVEIDVFSEEIFNGNPPERCYICKRMIFSKACEIARSFGILTVIDGTNFDDLRELRLGMRAKSESGVVSPFADCQLNKSEIRQLARELSLQEGAEKVSSTCLMTRFEVGAKVSLEDLRVVERVEALVKSLGFELVRARMKSDKIVIEVAKERVLELMQQQNVSKIKNCILQSLKKDFEISLDGYKLGGI